MIGSDKFVVQETPQFGYRYSNADFGGYNGGTLYITRCSLTDDGFSPLANLTFYSIHKPIYVNELVQIIPA